MRDGKQAPTVPVTAEEIMSTPEFALGVLDRRAGRGFRHVSGWSINQV